MLLKRITLVFLPLICIFALMACSDDVDKGEEISAYILKIDGKEVGYIKNEEELQALKDTLTKEKEAELSSFDTEIIRVTVNSSIESAPAQCYEKDLLSAEEIARRYREDGNKISFSVTVSEKEIKYISFETVYNNSSSYYEGTKVVKTKGQNGESELTYEVTYTDGVESERRVIKEDVKKEAVNEVVLVGTKKSTASTGKYAWPLKSVAITSSYGGRILNGSYDFHLGVDLRAATGTSIYAADGGKVIYAAYMGSYGYLVKIRHDNGDQTYYAHLSKINVTNGTRVYKGQFIAKSGATGNVTGPHLHFEIRKSGSTVNPVNYLPSLRGVIFDYNASLESCSVQTTAYQFRFALPASLSSSRAREEIL